MKLASFIIKRINVVKSFLHDSQAIQLSKNCKDECFGRDLGGEDL